MISPLPLFLVPQTAVANNPPLKITTHKHDFVATSTPNSAWAVWREHGKGRPAITGPPVEYGEGEEAYVAAIAQWFEGLDAEKRERMVRSSGGGEDVEAEFDL